MEEESEIVHYRVGNSDDIYTIYDQAGLLPRIKTVYCRYCKFKVITELYGVQCKKCNSNLITFIGESI
jgi:hypothetical protein